MTAQIKGEAPSSLAPYRPACRPKPRPVTHDYSRRRPPYARLLDERRQSTTNTWWLLIGADAWRTARTWAKPYNRHRPFAVCPPGDDSQTFDWRMYRHAPAPVALLRCGTVDGRQLQALVAALFEAGSPRVYDLAADLVFARRNAA